MALTHAELTQAKMHRQQREETMAGFHDCPLAAVKLTVNRRGMVAVHIQSSPYAPGFLDLDLFCVLSSS